MNPAAPASVSDEFRDAFERHLPEILRHCYRMMGSFADAEDVTQDVFLRAWEARDSYSPSAPLSHWLMRIATNSCLKSLARRRTRGLPQLDRAAMTEGAAIERADIAAWVTPAPDSRLYSSPERLAEAREDVAVAFVALLQRLPPRQRAVVLLKDVVGWSSEEIAAALELTVASVSSALHRARETLASRPRDAPKDPSPETLQKYLRSWEEHDLDALVALLKEDVVLAMPPFATWVQGAEAVRRFYRTPRFEAYWSKGVLGTPTRANGALAVAWYTKRPEGTYGRHSIEVLRFDGEKIAESTHFVGEGYGSGFDVPFERCKT